MGKVTFLSLHTIHLQTTAVINCCAKILRLRISFMYCIKPFELNRQFTSNIQCWKCSDKDSIFLVERNITLGINIDTKHNNILWVHWVGIMDKMPFLNSLCIPSEIMSMQFDIYLLTVFHWCIMVTSSLLDPHLVWMYVVNLVMSFLTNLMTLTLFYIMYSL